MKNLSTAKYIIIFSISSFLLSCNSAPDNYSKGIESYNAKKYDEAINYFKLTPSENKEWIDSSKLMIEKSVNGMFETNDLGKITMFCKVFQYDSLVKPFAITTIKKYWNTNIEKKSLLCLNLFDSLRFILPGVNGIDTLMRKTEDAFFKGIWKCPKGTLKGNEIYFNRNDETKLIDGKSNKATNGWDLGKTIYKDIYYIGNNKLDHKVRVFVASDYDYYYGYYTAPSEYFTKTKGSMNIISQDSLLVNYEGAVGSNNKVYFIRNK